MSDLIERLRNATGPDRELDAEIAKRVGTPHGPLEIAHLESRSIQYIDEQAPRYTASLDCAMNLVPEGWTTDIHTADATPETFPLGVTIITTPDDGAEVDIRYFPTWNVEPPSIAWAEAATPALALCIAALKAGEGA